MGTSKYIFYVYAVSMRWNFEHGKKLVSFEGTHKIGFFASKEINIQENQKMGKIVKVLYGFCDELKQ